MAKLKRRSISRRTVDALSVDRDTVFWDRELIGFGVRVYPSGAKYYIVQVRGPEGSKRLTVGRHGVITADQARQRAALIIARIKAGEDPIPSPLPPPPDGPTVGEIAARYLEQHVAVRCRASTASMYRRKIERYILPAFGALPLSAVTREQVAALHYELRDRPVLANHVVEVLSRLFTMAEYWGLAPEGGNPCRFVKPHRVRRRERFLTEEEFTRLGRVLAEAETDGPAMPSTVAAIRLLMLTGCRRSEILELQWDDVDLERRELRLRHTKTGPRTVPLNPAAVQVLAGLRRAPDNPWVLPGRQPGRRISSLNEPWLRLRKRAGLEDVRLHDLRHSFASRALALGESLPMIARLLGHAEVQTTAHYAHLSREALNAAAARIADSIGEDILRGSAGLRAAERRGRDRRGTAGARG